MATFLLLFLLLGILVQEIVPLLMEQINTLTQNLPQLIGELDKILTGFNITATEDVSYYLDMINHSFEDLINLLFIGLKSSTSLLFSFISSSFLIISLVPVMLYYMLKNTNKEIKISFIPDRYKKLALDYFIAIEKVLSDYISGKATVCFYVFAGAFLCFRLAGLPAALLFAVVTGIMDIVPYFGPWIGTFSAVLAALTAEDANIWIIVIGIILVQLGESYIVSPLVMSKEMKLHPLAVIIALLLAGQLFGLLGMITILPLIALIKVSLIYIK